MATLNDDPSLSVIPPTTITDGMLASSTIAENEYPVWTVGATFALGAFCIAAHRIYQSQIASNTGHDPTDINNRAGALIYWTDIGPTNQRAMFDDEVDTQTITPAGTDLTVVVNPGFFDSIYLGGLDSGIATIVVDDPTNGEILLTYSGTLEGSQVDDYWEWCYAPFAPLTDLLITDLTPAYAARITMTLSNGSGTNAIGMFAVGMIKLLGVTQYGANASPKTYSTMKLDDFGRMKIKRRGKAKNLAMSAELDLEESNSVLDTVTQLLDIPAVWIGTNIPVYGGLRGFGLGSGKMTYPSHGRAFLEISVQGML